MCNGNFGTGRPQCQRAWLDGRTLVHSYHKGSWEVQIVNEPEGYQILIVHFYCYIEESHSESLAIKWISHSEQHFPLGSGGSGERNTKWTFALIHEAFHATFLSFETCDKSFTMCFVFLELSSIWKRYESCF